MADSEEASGSEDDEYSCSSSDDSSEEYSSDFDSDDESEDDGEEEGEEEFANEAKPDEGSLGNSTETLVFEGTPQPSASTETMIEPTLSYGSNIPGEETALLGTKSKQGNAKGKTKRLKSSKLKGRGKAGTQKGKATQTSEGGKKKKKKVKKKSGFTKTDDSESRQRARQHWRSILPALKDLELQDYKTVFQKEGIDDIETLESYSVEDLVNVGVKGGHARKLLKYASKSSLEGQEVEGIESKPDKMTGSSSVDGIELEADDSVTDVFLSHNWGEDIHGRDNHERVKKINKLLKDRGYKTWCDEEKMTGDIVKQMCAGIDNTKVVLVFLTKRYLEKVDSEPDVPDNCKKEFMYAARKHSSAYMLPVLMEAELRDPRTWPGPVGFELGGVLYSNLSEESELTLDGTGFQHLCSEIDSRLRLRRKSKSK